MKFTKYLAKIYENNLQNHGPEGPKSRSGGSKLEVWRVQNRGFEGFLAVLGAAGRSWDYPEGVVVRLRGVLEPPWGRFGCVLGASWGAGRLSLRSLGTS